MGERHKIEESPNQSIFGNSTEVRRNLSLNNSLIITPIQQRSFGKISPIKRYSLAPDPQPLFLRSPKNSGGSKSSILLRKQNRRLSTHIDSLSPGLASRIVQYAEEKERNSTPPPKRYGVGSFPIVHFFKKDLPILNRRALRGNDAFHSADLSSLNTPEHNKLLLGKVIRSNSESEITKSEENTRSVLDALREISRKRIHTDEEVQVKEGKRACLEPNDKQKTSPLVENRNIKTLMDELTASYSSTVSERITPKRKFLEITTNTDNSLSPEKPLVKKAKEYATVETQTPVVKEPVKTEAKVPTPIQEKKKQREQIFDDVPLAIVRNNRLADLIGVEKDDSKEKIEETPVTSTPSLVSILTTNKSPVKSTKHVTFNLPTSTDSLEVKSSPISITNTTSSLVTPIVSPSEASSKIAPATSMTPVTTFGTIIGNDSAKETPITSTPSKTTDSLKLPAPELFKPSEGGFKFDLKAGPSPPKLDFTPGTTVASFPGAGELTFGTVTTASSFVNPHQFLGDSKVAFGAPSTSLVASTSTPFVAPVTASFTTPTLPSFGTSTTPSVPFSLVPGATTTTASSAGFTFVAPASMSGFQFNNSNAGFGTTVATTATGFGAGAVPATTPGFGVSATSTTAAFGATTTGFGVSAASTTAAFGATKAGFGASVTTTSGFSTVVSTAPGFGASTSGFGTSSVTTTPNFRIPSPTTLSAFAGSSIPPPLFGGAAAAPPAFGTSVATSSVFGASAPAKPTQAFNFSTKTTNKAPPVPFGDVSTALVPTTSSQFNPFNNSTGTTTAAWTMPFMSKPGDGSFGQATTATIALSQPSSSFGTMFDAQKSTPPVTSPPAFGALPTAGPSTITFGAPQPPTTTDTSKNLFGSFANPNFGTQANSFPATVPAPGNQFSFGSANFKSPPPAFGAAKTTTTSTTAGFGQAKTFAFGGTTAGTSKPNTQAVAPFGAAAPTFGATQGFGGAASTFGAGSSTGASTSFGAPASSSFGGADKFAMEPTTQGSSAGVFTFGGGAAAVAPVKAPLFAFGGTDAAAAAAPKAAFNFSAPGTNGTPRFPGAALPPAFGVPGTSSSMFNIGTGGTARQRTPLKAKRRT